MPYKPLPLKQRTSSVDHRRDYSTQTWISLLGLLKPREFLVTVDHFSIWRRHLAWAMEDGKELREYMTKRYASSMVFMSLLLSTELGVLFNSAAVTEEVREALRAEEHGRLSFWVGMCIILSAILTLLGLISSFTAWTMVSAVSDANAHCIFRSSIGQYAAELPGRFIVGSIYAFLMWVVMFFFILMPFGVYSNLLLLVAAALFVHTITAFSSFGRVIMHSGAMGSERIFDPHYEETLLPHTLHQNILTKARANLANHTSIMRQYRSSVEPLRRHYSQDQLSTYLSEASNPTPPPPPQRNRTESLVKFSDGFDTTGKVVPLPETIHFNGAKLRPSTSSSQTPISILSTESPSSSSGRPPLRSSNTHPGHSRQWSNGSVSDPSPAQTLRKALQATDSTAVFAKWLSSEGGQLSTVAEPSVDGSQGSHSGSGGLSRSRKRSSEDSEVVPRRVGSRSYSCVSSLDEMDKEDHGLMDEDRFNDEYGQLFEPYVDEAASTPRIGSTSERDSLLERSERGEARHVDR